MGYRPFSDSVASNPTLKMITILITVLAGVGLLALAIISIIIALWWTQR
jgi:hypothetical protein